MLKLVVYTQILENYGAHDWDGKGQCPQAWKPKAGDEYIIAWLSYQEAAIAGYTDLSKLVDDRSPRISRDDDYFHEYVLDWKLLEEDELTHSEKDQLEFDGEITEHPDDISEPTRISTWEWPDRQMADKFAEAILGAAAKTNDPSYRYARMVSARQISKGIK